MRSRPHARADPATRLTNGLARAFTTHLAVDNLVGIFSRIFQRHWGPRIDDTLRVACLTLMQHANPTLALVPPLLNDDQFRAQFTAGLDDPAGLHGYWQWYDSMNPPMRAQVIGPVLARLRAFLLRDFVENTLGGPTSSFDMGDVLNGGLLLVRLPKGVLGEDAARVLGSLVVARVWQAATARATRPERSRRDATRCVDECQNFLYLPGSVADMVAEARGYRLSLVLAHQDLAQLPKDVAAAASANARTKVFFTVDPSGRGLLLMSAIVTAPLSAARRELLVRRIGLLVAATITYNVVEAVVAITAGTIASSTALIGFGLDSVIEVSSAAAVAWQFTGPDHERKEKTALRIIAVSFFALVAYISVESARALLGGTEASHATVGLALAAVSLAVMPLLSYAQRRAGRALGSRSAVADSKQTLLCTYLSAVLLVGLGVNTMFGWAWADPLVAPHHRRRRGQGRPRCLAGRHLLPSRTHHRRIGRRGRHLCRRLLRTAEDRPMTTAVGETR